MGRQRQCGGGKVAGRDTADALPNFGHLRSLICTVHLGSSCSRSGLLIFLWQVPLIAHKHALPRAWGFWPFHTDWIPNLTSQIKGKTPCPKQLTGGKAYRWSQLIRLLLALHMGGNLVKANPQASHLILECTP